MDIVGPILSLFTLLLFLLPFLMLAFAIFLVIENWKFKYKPVNKLAAYVSIVPLLLLATSIWYPLQYTVGAEEKFPPDFPAGVYVDQLKKDTIKIVGRRFSFHYANSSADNFVMPSASLTEYTQAKTFKSEVNDLQTVYNTTPSTKRFNDYYTLSIYGNITYLNPPAKKPTSRKKKGSSELRRPICRKYRVTLEQGYVVMTPLELGENARFVRLK